LTAQVPPAAPCIASAPPASLRTARRARVANHRVPLRERAARVDRARAAHRALRHIRAASLAAHRAPRLRRPSPRPEIETRRETLYFFHVTTTRTACYASRRARVQVRWRPNKSRKEWLPNSKRAYHTPTPRRAQGATRLTLSAPRSARARTP
jgi:hypothetical protein